MPIQFNSSGISLIESLLRIFALLSFIGVAYKSVQALNIYISKNSKH